MAWVVVPALEALRVQLNAVAPSRDKTSDGSIGDTSHAAGKSSHNPDRTGSPEYADGDSADEVRARDFDVDLNTPGLTMLEVVRHLVTGARAGRFWWLRYVIFQGVIYHKNNGWAARTYTGVNGHFHHAHVNNDFTQAADTVRGVNYGLEDLVALTAEDKTWIKDNVGPAKVWAELITRPDGTKVSAGTILAWRDAAEKDTRNQITAAIKDAVAADDNDLSLSDEQVGMLAGLVSAQLVKGVGDDLAARLTA